VRRALRSDSHSAHQRRSRHRGVLRALKGTATIRTVVDAARVAGGSALGIILETADA
jgi:hypothetical protein